MDFILNVFNVFVSTYPNWSCSDIWEIFCIDFILFVWTKNIEIVISLLRWFGVMNNLVKVVVNNFSKINN